MRARQVNDLEVKQQFHELTFWRNAPFRLQLGNLALEPRELQLLRIHLTLPGKRMLRIALRSARVRSRGRWTTSFRAAMVLMLSRTYARKLSRKSPGFLASP